MRHFISVLLVTACPGGDDADTGAATTAPTGSTAATSTTDGSGTATTSTTDGTSAAATSTESSTDATGSTSGASTTHTSHVTHTTTDASSTTTTTGGMSSTTGSYQPPTPEELCACLVGGACHDFFHAKYGEDHEAAEAACLAEAEALPSAGMASESGNNIECRYQHCEAAAQDVSACNAALGGAPCM